MDKNEKAEAKERIANLIQAAAELTQALGMPREDMFDVFHTVYSDRFQKEAGEASNAREPMAEQRQKHPQSRRAAWVMTVTTGTLVTVRARDGERRVFRMLGPSLLQPANAKGKRSGLRAKIRSYTGYKLIYSVSYQSPLAEALMGHKVGDRVRLPLPDMKIGTKEFIILDITYENNRKL